MNKLLLVLFAFLTTPLFAASPIIYYGTHSKDLTTAGLITQALQAGSTGQFNVSTVGLVSTTNGLRVGSSAQFQVSSVGNVITTGNVSAGGLLSVDGNSHSFSFAGANLTSDYTVQVPATSGTVGQYMATDGSGNLNWRAPPTEKNYLAAGTNDSTGWAASGAGITCTTASTNLPDASVGTALAVTGVSGSTAFCYADYDVDVADYSKVLKLVFDQAPVSGYVASDFKVDVYSCTVAWVSGSCSGTSTRLSLSTDSSSITALPNLTGTVTPPPTYSAPNGTAPHVQVQIGLNAASTHQMNFAQIVTGPGTVVQSAAVGPWTSYVATVSGAGTSTVTLAQYRQVGDGLQIQGRFTSGTPAGTELQFSLPSGYTLNSARYAVTTVVGSAAVSYNTAASFVALAKGATTGVGYINFGVEGASNNALTIGTGTNIINASGNFVAFEANVAIAELAGQGTVFLGQGVPAYYYGTGLSWGSAGTLTTKQGEGGVLGGTTTPSGASFNWWITPTAPIPTGAIPILQISADGVNYGPVGMFTQSVVVESLHFDGTNYIGAAAYPNNGQIEISWGKYPQGGATAWSGTWYWRVFVGYPLANGFKTASATAPGLVSGEDSGTFSASFTGPRSTSDTITYSRVGKTVTLLLPSDASGSCTSGTHFTASGVIPSALRPATQSPTAAIPVRDNTSDLAAMGGVNVTTGGNILINANEASANFTGSGTCGWYSGVITYPVN